MRLRLVAPLLVLAAVSGCSGEPFVDRNYGQIGVQKEPLPGYRGDVAVCYTGQTPRAEVEGLARDACAAWGLEAVLTADEPWQCRLTVPHRAQYRCVDPKMRLADGDYVNPFDKEQVARWKRQQAKGKAAGAE